MNFRPRQGQLQGDVLPCGADGTRSAEAVALRGFTCLAVSLVVSFLVSFASVRQRPRCSKTAL